MKTSESYGYEHALLRTLDESFQKAVAEQKYAEQYGKDNATMKDYANESMDKAIWQKEIVEAVIGHPVNLQIDGKIRIGLDNLISYEEYLKNLESIAHIGDLCTKTVLEDNNRLSTGGVSFEGETLADFIGENEKKYINPVHEWERKGKLNLEVLNQDLYDCGIKTIDMNRLIENGRFVFNNSAERDSEYAKNRFGDEKVKLMLPKFDALNYDIRFDSDVQTGAYMQYIDYIDNPSISVPKYMLGEFLGDDVIDNFLDDYTSEDTEGFLMFIQKAYPSYDYKTNSNLKEVADKVYEDYHGEEIKSAPVQRQDTVRIEVGGEAIVGFYDKDGQTREMLDRMGKKAHSKTLLKMDIPVDMLNKYLDDEGLISVARSREVLEGIVEGLDVCAFDRLPQFIADHYPDIDPHRLETAVNDIRYAGGWEIYSPMAKEIEMEYMVSDAPVFECEWEQDGHTVGEIYKAIDGEILRNTHTDNEETGWKPVSPEELLARVDNIEHMKDSKVLTALLPVDREDIERAVPKSIATISKSDVKNSWKKDVGQGRE